VSLDNDLNSRFDQIRNLLERLALERCLFDDGRVKFEKEVDKDFSLMTLEIVLGIYPDAKY